MTDLQEFIKITRDTLARLSPDSNLFLTRFRTIDELKAVINKDLEDLEQGDLNKLINVYIHFAPTGTFSEIWIDDQWEKEELDVCGRIDELYARLKFRKKTLSDIDKIKLWFSKLLNV